VNVSRSSAGTGLCGFVWKKASLSARNPAIASSYVERSMLVVLVLVFVLAVVMTLVLGLAMAFVLGVIVDPRARRDRARRSYRAPPCRHPARTGLRCRLW
jgi:hypothetical protein